MSRACANAISFAPTPDSSLNLRECLEETIHKLCILNIYPFPEFSDRTSRTLLSRATPQPQPLLTRIYDAAWPRARLMRQTYVCRGCGRTSSASGADRVYVGRDSKRSPISGPTRGKLFDQSVRRILIVSTVQCNCINDTYNVSTRRGVKETRVSRKFRNWRFFHARRFVENLSNIRDIRRRGILK